MARYTDIDALLSELPEDLPYKASVKRVLIQAPEADVAPKSEVIEEFVNRLKERLYTIPTVYNSHFSRMVDNIAKDMKGERDV